MDYDYLVYAVGSTAAVPDSVPGALECGYAIAKFEAAERLRSAVTVWTAGLGVPDLAARSALRTDALGRLLTDETLTSVDDLCIVAAGDKVARAIVGRVTTGMQIPEARVDLVTCNAAPAIAIYLADHPEGVFTVEIIDGKITNLYAMRNPDKLTAAATVRRVSRN